MNSSQWIMANPEQVYCKLDDHECISLLSILKAFDGPINEERTWAVLYQASKCALDCFAKDSTKCFSLSEVAQLYIHRDGHVHQKSFFLDTLNVDGRTIAGNQAKLVSSLGWAIFEALDYGCTQEEGHVLSPDLEQMIDLMTSAGGECNSAEDEGIERDSGDAEETSSVHCIPMTSLNQVLDRCQMQISSTASSVQADTHFRAVCRALVAETLEFSDFLVKVTSAPEKWKDLRGKPESQCPELTELHLGDWAKLWMQVIRQLRNGVKLKSKSESARKPIEYELTPYEMMMDDIRSRRYKLRTVLVDGQIPQRVKKDAHAVILEFIRSRPPLRKASERMLGPPARRVSTPVELLMESIRQHDHKGLRPTKSLMVEKTETMTKKKLLKADFTSDLLLNSVSDEDDDLEEVLARSPPRPCISPSFNSGPASVVSTPQGGPRESRNQPTPFPNSFQCNREASPSRRHSIPSLTRTNSTPFPKSQSHNSQLSSYAVKDQRRRIEPGSLPCSGPSSSASSTSSVSIPSPPGSPMLPVLDPLLEHRQHLQDEFLQSKHFHEDVDCLSLTLEEMVHIRHTLTRADLDALPLDSTIKADVASGKVCFVCRKTRFSMFGSWGQQCKLCRQRVCAKCWTKIRIPTEHFSSIPVFTLSPVAAADSSHHTSPMFSNIHLRLPQFRLSGSSTEEKSESAPNSPSLARRKEGISRPNSLYIHSWQQNQSLSAESTPKRNRLSVPGSRTEVKKPMPTSTEYCVCMDCQSLIDKIIQVSNQYSHRPDVSVLPLSLP